jgi:hypothetical protein
MPSECKQLVLGLPGSGKTTFLAALWYLVVWAEVPTALRLDRLHGNKEHLNRISSDWLSCRPVERTPIGSETIASMKLVSTGEADERAEVFFPDMSGELFNLQWKERRCSRAHYELARAASGVVLFVHPSALLEPVRIDEVAPIVDDVGLIGSDDGEEDAPSPWDADRAPTQVKLVELLQFLFREPFSLLHARVAVIVSAWDLVAARAASPAAWLTARLPLLDQYLRGNPERYTARVYGISAPGGDLGRDGERLLSKAMPAERIIVVGDESQPHDLTAPVSWLMR